MQQQIRPHADVFDIQDRVVFVSNSDFVSNCAADCAVGHVERASYQRRLNSIHRVQRFLIRLARAACAISSRKSHGKFILSLFIKWMHRHYLQRAAICFTLRFRAKFFCCQYRT
jgi:hypothetical protein